VKNRVYGLIPQVGPTCGTWRQSPDSWSYWVTAQRYSITTF
jgi:hypothetical protein